MTSLVHKTVSMLLKMLRRIYILFLGLPWQVKVKPSR